MCALANICLPPTPPHPQPTCPLPSITDTHLALALSTSSLATCPFSHPPLHSPYLHTYPPPSLPQMRRGSFPPALPERECARGPLSPPPPLPASHPPPLDLSLSPASERVKGGVLGADIPPGGAVSRSASTQTGARRSLSWPPTVAGMGGEGMGGGVRGGAIRAKR